MKVLFLDVDGVLNSLDWMMGQNATTIDGVWGMDYKAVNLLRYIIQKTNCKIVVSSTWRIEGLQPGSHFHDELTRTDPSGIILNAVIDRTTSGGDSYDRLGRDYVRGDEIRLWMDDNDFKGNFAILDDDSDMSSVMSNLVQTRLQTGLTKDLAKKVIDLLNSVG